MSQFQDFFFLLNFLYMTLYVSFNYLYVFHQLFNPNAFIQFKINMYFWYTPGKTLLQYICSYKI